MRIRIHLQPEQVHSDLPLDYHYPLASLVYNTMAISSPDYASFLHEEGYGRDANHHLVDHVSGSSEQAARQVVRDNKRFKLFVFSRLDTPDARIERDRLRVGRSIIRWQVSSPIDQFMQNFVSGLIKEERVLIGDELGGSWLAVQEIEEISPPRINTNMRFIALSPLMVAIEQTGPQGDRQKHYLRADDSRFGPAVASNLIEKYRALTGTDPADKNLSFDFDWSYIKRRGGIERVSKLVNYKGIKIKSYMAPFIVSGSSELIRLGWECGFGGANSQGFGMGQADA